MDFAIPEDSEEFNNFLHRVNDVSSIIKKLASTNKELQEIGALEADGYLKDTDVSYSDSIDEENVKTFVRHNKTVINKKALEKDNDPDTMSREAFMEEVSRDADRRFKDKQIRKEKADTFKKLAGLAFQRGEYEKALVNYDKAIAQIGDSCQLYLNRCVTEIQLHLFEKALNDAETALKLNEDSLRGWLLMAKAYKNLGNQQKFENAIAEAKKRKPDRVDLIEEYEGELENEKVIVANK